MRNAIVLILLCLHMTAIYADVTIFGLVVSEPKTSYDEGAQPIAGVPVRFAIGGETITAATGENGAYEVILPSSVAVETPPKPTVGLFQNYPNPFNPTTVIPFTLAEASDVTLSVFNVLGQRVRVCADGYHAAGLHSYVWDGCDDDGRAVSAGVYIYRLKAGQTVLTGKMLLVDGGGASGAGGRGAENILASAKPASPSNTCIMTIAAEGYVAWADTFHVYEQNRSRKDVIMRRKGGVSDVLAERLGCRLAGCWGDFPGGGDYDPPATFDFDIWDEKYSSSTLKEKGIVVQVPWSHETVDSVYVTITESPKPERINLTIPMIIHFWNDMGPVVTNIDELSDGILNHEIMSLIHRQVGKQ